MPGYAFPFTKQTEHIQKRARLQLFTELHLHANTTPAAQPTVTVASLPNPSDYGQPVTFTATVTGGFGTPTGNVAFQDDGTDITGCEAQPLNGSGQATCSISTLATGTHANITAVYSGNASYSAGTSSAYSHTVNQASTTTSLNSDPNPSTYGQSVTFTATVTSGGGTPTGTVVFQNDGSDIAGCSAQPLNGSGQATCSISTLAAGTHTNITAIYSGDTNFNGSASDAFTQNVTQATPVITWDNPADIIYGTALDATQLNATADVPGSFVYTPDSGTILDVGTHTLHVDFTPDDAVNYASASKEVSINVLDGTAPWVISITRADPDPTDASTVNFIVTFSESVAGVDLSDFTLTTTGVSGATLSGFSGSNATCTVTVSTGSDNGTIRLDIPVTATITDMAGNPLFGLPYTSGEAYYIVKTAPVPITPFNEVDSRTNRPFFEWTPFPGAAQYQIQISTDSDFKSKVTKATVKAPLTSYIPKKNLLPNTTYYWHVSAKVGKTYTPWSQTWSFETGNPPPVPVLTAPGNNKTVAGPSPLFDWKDVKDIVGVTFDHYEIQISTDANFTAIFDTGYPTISQYNGFTLTPGTYYWRVRSVADNGDFSAWSQVRIVIIQ